MVLARYTVRKPVNRTPLRVAYVGATRIDAGGARACRTGVGARRRAATPRRAGAITQLRVELPQLAPRSGPAADRGRRRRASTVLSSPPAGSTGSETVWNVRVLVRPTAPPGQVPLILRAVFADGVSVEEDDSLTVVPAAGPGVGRIPLARRRGRHAARAGARHAVLLLARRRTSAPAAGPSRLVASASRAVRAVSGRRPRVCVVPGRRRGRRRRRDRRSTVRDRTGAVRRPPTRGRDRPGDRDPHARRPPVRPRPARARARHPGLDPRRQQRPSTARACSTDGLELELGQVVLRAIHTPGHRPGAHVPRGHRSHPRRRALARAHRRLALRRRHGPPGSRSRRESRAPKGSSTRSAGCSSCRTASRSSPAISPARSAARA